MRVEGFDLQEPIIGGPVGLEEIEAVGEALGGGKLGFLADEFAIDHVASVVGSLPFRVLARVVFLPQAFPWWRDHRLPRITLLSADEILAVVAGVVGRAAVFEVVIMVGDQVAVDAGWNSSCGKELSNGSSGPQLRCRKDSRPVCMSRRAGMQGRLPT